MSAPRTVQDSEAYSAEKQRKLLSPATIARLQVLMAAHAKSATSVRVYNDIHSHKRHPLRPHFRPTLRPMPSWGSLSHMSSRRDLRVAHGQAGSAASDTNVRGSVSATAQRCHPFYGPHRRAACGGVRFMRSVLSVSASAQVRGGVRGTLSGRASVRLHGIDLCLGVCVWGGGSCWTRAGQQKLCSGWRVTSSPSTRADVAAKWSALCFKTVCKFRCVVRADVILGRTPAALFWGVHGDGQPVALWFENSPSAEHVCPIIVY